MLPHEGVALAVYGLNHRINTADWTLETIPADHRQQFTQFIRERRAYSIERRNEPDDPHDQAFWNERINEWNDILRTLGGTNA